VNVEHLFLGSPSDNTKDMMDKNRHGWREGTPWQKLNSVDGERISDLRLSGCTQQEAADWFGVSRPLISLIETGKISHSRHLFHLRFKEQRSLATIC
jgi:DNA-binding XRE family transcriptional regulator